MHLSAVVDQPYMPAGLEPLAVAPPHALNPTFPPHLPQLPPVTSFSSASIQQQLPKLQTLPLHTSAQLEPLSHSLRASSALASSQPPVNHISPTHHPPHRPNALSHAFDFPNYQHPPTTPSAVTQPPSHPFYSTPDQHTDTFRSIQDSSPPARQDPLPSPYRDLHAHSLPLPTSSVTFSPVSAAQQLDSAVCVSPLSVTNQPASTDNATLPSSLTLPEPPTGNIDDSLLACLRGSLRTASVISNREPQIRDTTESLAAGLLDGTVNNRVAGQAPQSVASPPLDRPHACKKCNTTFRRRDNLMAHIRAQHKGERPFRCEVCGFRFIKKDHAMKHWKVVHLKERPFGCDRCGSKFGQRSDLNKHVKSVHLKIKPFACEHCGLRFSHRGNQIRHQAVVHEKRKPHRCGECDSSFAEKSNLLKHQQAVHKMGVAMRSRV